jgi:hypothetical protein
MGSKKPKPSMRIADWSAEVAELRVISERLATLGQLIAASGQLKSAPKFGNLPRPETAAERVKYRKGLEKHQQLTRILIPKKEE